MFGNVLAPKSYQRRIIAYFDVLGWRGHIERANEDTTQIPLLHAVVQALAMGARPGIVPNAEPQRFYTSFSDHVVVSLPLDLDDLPAFLDGVGAMQLGIATIGFFLRGAITIGQLYHDREVVFGPGLVRAYDLESKAAKFPRIVVDPLVDELSAHSVPFLVEEDEYRMLDPFTEAFAERVANKSPPASMMSAYTESLGIRDISMPMPALRTGSLVLSAILWHLGRELNRPIDADARLKLAWLFDRIGARIQYPVRSTDFPTP